MEKTPSGFAKPCKNFLKKRGFRGNINKVCESNRQCKEGNVKVEHVIEKIGTVSWKANIKARLEKLPRKKQVHFAWLCTVRVLPYLSLDSNEEPFSYWGAEKDEYLTSVLTALDIAAKASLDRNIVDTLGGSDNVYVVANNAYATADATYVAIDNTYVATDATYAAADAAYATAENVAKNDEYFLSVIQRDLQYLEKGGARTPQQPERYKERLSQFFADLRKVGFGYWASWYAQLFANGLVLNGKRLQEINNRLSLPVLQEDESKESETDTMPNDINFRSLEITEDELKTLCEARYTVIAGENGCGKTRLLRILEQYITKEEPEAVPIFADFANAYFTFEEAQDGESNLIR